MKNWSLNAKIALIIGLLSCGGIGTSYLGISKMAFIRDIMAEITGTLVKRDQLTSLILDQQRQVAIQNRNIVIERKPERMEKMEQELIPIRAELFNLIQKYSDIAAPEGKELARKYKEALEPWIAVNGKVRALTKQVGKEDEVSTIMEKEEAPLRAKTLEYLKDMNALTAKRLQDATNDAEASYQSAKIFMIIVSVCVILSCILLATFIMVALGKSIDQVISNLEDSSGQVTSASQQIAASSEQLSQAATEQASSLEETASSIEELSSMIQKNSENAKKSSSISTTSQDSARKGKEVVQEMISAIEGINVSNNNIMQQINESNAQISDIVKVISEIGGKTKVINDIVFQTKLLSFNASVEAARAGEHGKGFAVVAEEVGNLAQVSGNAAQEISGMLDKSIQKVEGIVTDTKAKVERLITDGREKVEQGTHIAQQCGTVLEEIVSSVSTVAQMVTEISSASEEQAQGVQEITKAMSQLDQVTQENASTSEEAASAAEELSSQAEALKAVVTTLIQTVKGGSNASVSRHGAEYSKNTVKKRKSEHHDVVPSSKIIHLKNEQMKRAAVNGSSKLAQKKVVGMDNGVPSEADPRFKDI
jgi:methyl-accepting chemotaxis protein